MRVYTLEDFEAGGPGTYYILRYGRMEMENEASTERMLKWFEFAHLPENLQATSRPFGELASSLCDTIKAGPERTVALRKLLEAKDAAVRAKLNPGG